MIEHPYRLLAADDELLEEPYIASLFSLRGFHVEMASTGIDAWKKLCDGSYHACVLDNMLPGGGEPGSEWSSENTGNCLHTGLKVLEKMADLPKQPLVWVLTALPDNAIEDKERAFPFVVAVLKKKFSFRKLADDIWAYLESHQEHLIT